MLATGTFDVKLTPAALPDMPSGPIAMMAIDKQFQGELDASSKGFMLTAFGSVKGSAGYVAMEVVTGVLAGRSGSFVLQHSATMTRGAPQQTIAVVPDSGTSELAGLEGRMTITIAEEKHSYSFEYSLQE